MPVEIDGPRLPPASGGTAKQSMILLHGYGADGNDLIGLGHEMGRNLPDAAFVSPNAPHSMPAGFMGGRQWFPLDSHSEEELLKGVQSAQPILEAFILAEAVRTGLPLSSMALVGFSQGTMMALYTGLRLAAPLAAIVGFSGHLIGAERLPAEIKSKPPVLLIHGQYDEVIPVQAIHHAHAALDAVGVPNQWQVRPGIGHGIDPQGLAAATLFLRAAFGIV